MIGKKITSRKTNVKAVEIKPTFSGTRVVYLDTDNACFPCSFSIPDPDSLFSCTDSGEGSGEDSDKLFSLSRKSSFKFTRTSPLVISRFLTSTPASLHQGSLNINQKPFPICVILLVTDIPSKAMLKLNHCTFYGK